MNLNPLNFYRRIRQLPDMAAAVEVDRLKSAGGRLVYVRQVTQTPTTGTKALIDLRVNPAEKAVTTDAWFPHRRVRSGWVYAAASVNVGHGPHTGEDIVYVEGLYGGLPAKKLEAAQRDEERRFLAELDTFSVPAEWKNPNLRHPSGAKLTKQRELDWLERFYLKWWRGGKGTARTVLRPYVGGLSRRPLRITWPAAIITFLMVVVAAEIKLDALLEQWATANPQYPDPSHGAVPPDVYAQYEALVVFPTLKYGFWAAVLIGGVMFLLAQMFTHGWSLSHTTTASHLQSGEHIKVPWRFGFIAARVDRVVVRNDGLVSIHLPTTTLTVKSGRRFKVVQLRNFRRTEAY